MQQARTARFTLVTSEGELRGSLHLKRVPYTVSNFVDLAQRKFYDGQKVHLVSPGFIVQMGCPHSRDDASARCGLGGAPESSEFAVLAGEFKGKKASRDAGGNIRDEFVPSMVSNRRGTLAMARSALSHSASSQFFVNLADNSFLDWNDERNPAQCVVFGELDDDADATLKRLEQIPVVSGISATDVELKSVRVTL